MEWDPSASLYRAKLRLTAAGLEAADYVRQKACAAVEAAGWDLSDSDRAVLYAALESIAARLEDEQENVRVIALLDTLEYLKKGGRISKTVAFAGDILSIKPVITLENGEVVILGKARGSKQGNNLLITEIQKDGGVDFTKPLMLGYTGLSDALLEKYVLDSGELWDGHGDCIRSTIIGSVIGTHAGPGAIAAAFFTK